MNTAALDRLVDRTFGRREVTEDEMQEWINENAFQIMLAAYPGCRELLEELDNGTYQDVLTTVLQNEFGDAIIEDHIRGQINWIQDESERSMNRKSLSRRGIQRRPAKKGTSAPRRR